MTIIGHTDRRGEEDSNKELSLYRAYNAVTAIYDISGDKIPDQVLPAKNIIPSGEKVASLTDKDNTDNPIHRRSEIILNGRLVLTLPSKSEKGNK